MLLGYSDLHTIIAVYNTRGTTVYNILLDDDY